MAHWLLKTEPDSYSFDDLLRDRKTDWDGVKNALALQNMRKMKKGDEVFIYHTGKERRVVGSAMITRAAYPDASQDDERLVLVDLRAGRRLDNSVSLADIKSNRKLEGCELLRIGRLSVVPLTGAEWREINRMSK